MFQGCGFQALARTLGFRYLDSMIWVDILASATSTPGFGQFFVGFRGVDFMSWLEISNAVVSISGSGSKPRLQGSGLQDLDG